MRRMLRKLRTALTGRGTMGVASLPSAAPAGLTEILETLDDGLLVTDLSLTIVQWNAAMERLSGLPRASAIGRNADRLLPLFDAIGLPRYLRRAVGPLSAEYANRGSIPSGGGPISRAVLESRTVTTPNILTDADVWLIADRRAQIEREGFKAVAAAPLLSKQRVHGALAVHYWSERTFTEAEVHALSLMGEQAALAIDNAHLYAEATRRADRLRELAELE